MVQMTGEAGTILILAKGDYDANVTYDILNLVNHNGLSWLAKKASTGIEPSDANAEYWHPFGTAVNIATKDAAGTVRPDGETITIDENGVISAVGGTAEKVTYENESVADVTNVKEALDGIFDGTIQVRDSANLGGKGASEYALSQQIKDNSLWNELTTGFDLNNALGKYRTANGNTLSTLLNLPVAWTKGEISVEWTPFNNTNAYGMQTLKYKTSVSFAVYYRVKNGETWGGEWEALATTADLANYVPLSAKPSGTYTGNGSTDRQVCIGDYSVDVYSTIVVSSSDNDTMAIVTRAGGAICVSSNGTVTKLNDSKVSISYNPSIGAVMVLATNNDCLNANGVSYRYAVH